MCPAPLPPPPVYRCFWGFGSVVSGFFVGGGGLFFCFCCWGVGVCGDWVGGWLSTGSPLCGGLLRLVWSRGVAFCSQQGIILLEGRGVIGRCLCTFRASLDKYSVAISDLCFERSCLCFHGNVGGLPL